MGSTNNKTNKVLAVEMLALSPNLTQKDLADKLGVEARTVSNWLNSPSFIDLLYKRYMETAGRELPLVIDAMIREAKHGNVQAGRLILEHFGKLDNRIKIQVQSPFEKFLKQEAQDGEFVEHEEITNGAISIGELAASLLPGEHTIPPRDIRNDNPRQRKKVEDKALKYVSKKARNKAKQKEIQREMYSRRKRAKAVELELLPKGRSSKGEREGWLKELEGREIEKFGQIQNFEED